MRKKLAIIGASFGQKPLFIKAKEMGIETHCFAWDEDAVCKEIADHFHPISVMDNEKILEVCQKIKIDGVCTIATDLCVPAVSYVAEKMGLTGNRYKDSLAAVNKYLMRQAFLKSGVNVPRFTKTKSEKDIELKGYNYPLIVKPTDRGASIGVMKVEKEVELGQAVKRAIELSFLKEAIIEEYIYGKEVCVLSISWNGKHYHLDIQDKETTGPPYYVEIGHHQPAKLSLEMQEKVKTETTKALTALNINFGGSDNELMITENGDVYIIEVNPRMGGDYTHTLVSLSTGYDFVKGVIDIALNRFQEPVINEQNYSGMFYYSKGSEWVKNVIENKEKYPEIIETEITNELLSTVQSSKDRCGFFIYKSDRKRTKDDYK